MNTEITPTSDLLQAIASGNVPELGDPKTVALSIIQSILEADSEADIFDTGGTIACKSLVGEVFTIHAVRLMQGQIEDAALPVYVLLDCEREDGERFVANTGAARIMGQALAMWQRSMFPKTVTVVELAAARPGQNAPIGLAVV